MDQAEHDTRHHETDQHQYIEWQFHRTPEEAGLSLRKVCR
jgi:hypothetical protein